MADLNKCPKCGGPADNGHDRCVPPNPYWCSCCKDKDFLDMVKTWEYVKGTNSAHIYELAYEAVALRREKYKTEYRASNLVDILSIEWCVKIYMHNEPMPSGCRSKTDEECHECWMKELGF